MTNLPEEEDARDLANSPANDVASHAPAPSDLASSDTSPAQPVDLTPDSAFDSYAASIGQPIVRSDDAPPISQPIAPASPYSDAEPPLFQSFALAPVRPPARIPNLGHLSLLALLLLVSSACFGVAFYFASHFLHFGLNLTTEAAAANVPLMLASETIIYLLTFALGFVIFQLLWHEKFFAGLQWRGAAALERFWPLAATAFGCAGLAFLDEVLMPGPSNAPIEKMMSAPGAAWLMFAFGTTVAPFFEEMFFRGFLLPALCTAWDWTVEQITHNPAPPLDANGAPQWSLAAMAVASVLTSIPFALLHVDQQGHALGPFLLLILISLILCAVRLTTRSLAASTLVHACYNFIIFSLALIGTGGFRHFDKM